MTPLRYLSSLLTGLTPAAPAPVAEEAWSWRRRGPWSPTLSLRHRDGSLVELRPLRPRDRLQWLGGMPELPIAGPAAAAGAAGVGEAELRLARLVSLDTGRHFAWAVVVRETDGWWGVGRGLVLGVRDEPGVAEVGVAVHADHRGRGVGRLLLRALAVSATVLGVERLRVRVLPDEERVLGFLRRFGPTTVEEGGLFRCDAPLATVVASLCCPGFTAELAAVTRCVDGQDTCPLSLPETRPWSGAQEPR